MANPQASPATVQSYLKGMEYPGNKDALILHARHQNAPDEVLAVLQRLPAREYDSDEQVAQGLEEGKWPNGDANR